MMRLGGRVSAVTTVRGENSRGAVILHFTNGVMGTLHLAGGGSPDRDLYNLYGADWSLRIEDAVITLQRGLPSFVYNETDNFAPPGFDSGAIVWNAPNCVATLENKALFTQGFYGETKYFCDCILENKQPLEGTLEFALEIMRVYEAALLSKGKTRAV
jgi:predicted dehydrogenase